jgi:hypothetical protein
MIQDIDSLIERGVRELEKGASIDMAHGFWIYENIFIPELKINPAFVAFLPVWQEAFFKVFDNSHASFRQKTLAFTHLMHDFVPSDVADELLLCLKQSDTMFRIAAAEIVRTDPGKFEGHPIIEFLQDAV